MMGILSCVMISGKILKRQTVQWFSESMEPAMNTAVSGIHTLFASFVNIYSNSYHIENLNLIPGGI